MKTVSCLALVALLPMTLLAAETAGTSGPVTEDQKTLYTLGVIVERNLQNFHLSPSELKFVMEGMSDQQKLDQKKATQLKVDLNAYGPKIKELEAKRVSVGSVSEKEKGKAFLAKMAKEPGAKTFPSGLVMVPIKEGTGDSPQATDTVKVDYEGTFIDGKVFDSSIKRGQPAEFPLNGVIKCWTEGVAKMKVGGKAKLGCPSDIAYGDQGSPGTIPGGATLVFQVNLLDIVKH